jgi:uridine phosphorylase
MVDDNDAVIIASRRGSGEKPCAPVAIMVCAEDDRRRLCRQAQPVAGSMRHIHHACYVDVIHAARPLTVAGPILGAPQAALVLEKLVALGSRAIVVLGWCGSLQPQLKIGDWLLPTGALSEEGTSSHYPAQTEDFAPDSTLFTRLQEYCTARDHILHAGPVWTTDAPLRETVTKVLSYSSQGLVAVEMEMSALFRVATYRDVRLAGLLIVSDELFTLKWRSGFRSPRFRTACYNAVQVVLDFCASLPPEISS